MRLFPFSHGSSLGPRLSRIEWQTLFFLRLAASGEGLAAQNGDRLTLKNDAGTFCLLKFSDEERFRNRFTACGTS